ncbi:MAG TPA: TonB-dependent receptor [Steroidobacteraceae bacterium]
MSHLPSLAITAVLCALTSVVCAQMPDSAAEGLQRLSLEELANVEVTSASKSSQPLSEAPAALYVITHDEIVRSGVQSIPEALRLAPNLQVMQLTANDYVVTARGLSGDPQAQSFSNKLLVLIDGRSVYTPLFSGVYFDAQDVLLDDVDRIEVISGPGATLWGANAMNGVINIITRAAGETQGVLVATGGGNLEKNFNARYGGALNDATQYRFYTKLTDDNALELPNGTSAHDAWSKAQGGFRLDWAQGADAATLQGDVYRATENQLGADDVAIAGANALARWQHTTDGSQLQLQAYVDQTQRRAPIGGDAFVLHTYDVEIQDSVSAGANQRVVFGAGERINSYGITNSASLLFIPPSRGLSLSDIFAQDTISLGRPLKLTIGLKLEDDPYWGWTPLPDVRLAWNLADRSLLWAAVSKAIRSPTPFDDDVVEKSAGSVALTGDPNFEPERLTAYEFGYRGEPTKLVSLSVSAFYNVYDDLRSIEPSPVTGFFPLRWGNGMQGDTYGLEAWSSLEITDWWRIGPGVRWQHEHLWFKPGASGLLGVVQAGDDPSTQASLRSSMDLGRSMTFDATLAHVAGQPSPLAPGSPGAPGYYDLTARFAWQVSRAVNLSLSGFNLTQAHHIEFALPYGEEISRSFIAEARVYLW